MTRTIRRLPGALAFAALLAGAFACRAQHLGARTGAAYHTAFGAQRSSKAASAQLDAADAKNTMRKHRAASARPETNAQAGLPALNTGEMWKGSSGDVRLEAK